MDDIIIPFSGFLQKKKETERPHFFLYAGMSFVILFLYGKTI